MPVLRSEWNEPLRAQRDPLAEDAGRVRANRDEHRHLPRQSWLGRFVATYGWRAYALPVLAVVTGLVLYQTVTGTRVETTADPIDTVQAGVLSGPVGRASTRARRRSARVWAEAGSLAGSRARNSSPP